MKILDGKSAIVIGGGRGIGRAVAHLFASEGARVLVDDTGADVHGNGTDASVAAAVAEEIRGAGGVAEACSLDVSGADGASGVVKACLDAFGAVDTLVHAAGVLVDAPLLRAGDDLLDRALHVHVKGAFFAIRSAAAHMQRAGGGRIVLTTSGAGLLGNFGQPAYSAAAGAVYGLMRTASVELQRQGVFVNAVAPIAKTARLTADLPMFEHVDTMTPEHAAPAYLFFGSELSSDLTGNVMSIAGGRLSLYKFAEGAGRFKETEDGVWTASEIRDQWSSMGRH